MQNFGKFSRLLLAAMSLAAGFIFSTGAMAQALNFRFQFTGNMSCMQPVPVSNAPIGGSGSGVLNPDGSVSAEITQSLLMFSTSLSEAYTNVSFALPASAAAEQVNMVKNKARRIDAAGNFILKTPL